MSPTPARRTVCRRIAICVPVRNEAARLPRLLDALERLETAPGDAIDICLLLDGCTDASAAIISSWRRTSPHRVHMGSAPRGEPNAGKARGLAMSLGLEALDGTDGILLTTDADGWPRGDWLRAMTAALDRADVVAGDVLRDDRNPSEGQDRLDRYYAALFALRRRVDPVPWEATATHHHASGANMGMRSATYHRLGGFRPVPHGEDALLIDDAGRAGLRVRRDAASVVVTSDRRSGRARHGLAALLQDLDSDGLARVAVAHPVDQLWQYRAHGVARDGFRQRRYGALTAMIGLDADHLTGVARDCCNAEAFAMRVVPTPPGGMRQARFIDAEAILATLAAAAMPAHAA